MQLDFTWVYPIHPLAVFQMATRLDHLDEKARHLGHERHAVKELRERDGVFRSVTERQVDTKIPWWAEKLRFKPRNMITQTQLWEPPAWDGSRHYETRVEVSRVPVSITGWGRLTPVDITSTRYEIHLDITSSIPLIGRKIVNVVAGAFEENVDAEHEFRLLWLGRTGNFTR